MAKQPPLAKVLFPKSLRSDLDKAEIERTLAAIQQHVPRLNLVTKRLSAALVDARGPWALGDNIAEGGGDAVVSCPTGHACGGLRTCTGNTVCTSDTEACPSETIRSCTEETFCGEDACSAGLTCGGHECGTAVCTADTCASNQCTGDTCTQDTCTVESCSAVHSCGPDVNTCTGHECGWIHAEPCDSEASCAVHAETPGCVADEPGGGGGTDVPTAPLSAAAVWQAIVRELAAARRAPGGRA
jgi:hypothetical protein